MSSLISGVIFIFLRRALLVFDVEAPSDLSSSNICLIRPITKEDAGLKH
jgi:hypothetical protein